MVDRAYFEDLVAPRREREDWPVPWAPVWGEKNGLMSHVEHLALRGVLGLVGRLPEPLLQVALRSFARLGPRIDRRHADAARDFLETALGPLDPAERERRVRQAYYHFFRVMVDGGRFARRVPFERIPEQFDVVLSDDARRLVKDGSGCVLVAAHLGNWELSTAILPWIGFDPLYPVGKSVKNRPLSKAIQHMRESRGVRLLPRRGAMKSAPAIIKAGGAIGLLLDQRARLRPVLAPFFGRPARCDRSAGVLLRRLRVPVAVTACTYTEDPLRFRFEISDVLWPDELVGASPETISTRINQALERQIRAYPDQYFWLHDRFRDAPPAVDEDEGEPGEDRIRPGDELSSRRPSQASERR